MPAARRRGKAGILFEGGEDAGLIPKLVAIASEFQPQYVVTGPEGYRAPDRGDGLIKPPRLSQQEGARVMRLSI